jgi:hypothetical protein
LVSLVDSYARHDGVQVTGGEQLVVVRGSGDADPSEVDRILAGRVEAPDALREAERGDSSLEDVLSSPPVDGCVVAGR